MESENIFEIILLRPEINMNWCPGHPYEKDAKTFNLALLFLAKMFSQDTMTAVCVCFRHDIVYRQYAHRRFLFNLHRDY